MTASRRNAPATRRQFLRGASTALLAVAGTELLASCAVGGGGPSGALGAGPTSADNPFGVVADAPLEVAIFKGGYGDAYATEIHQPLYKRAFPAATVGHLPLTEVGKSLQPRFAAGDPPDLVNNSGGGKMDFGALIADGQLVDLTALWDAPAVDDPTLKVRDTVRPGTIESGTYNGTPYVLNYTSVVYATTYSGKLFTERGWQPPTTWDDFLALCEEIKKAGITPYGYAGANAAYYQVDHILTLAAKIGGPQVLRDIDNLEDGAWLAEPVTQSLEAWAEVGAKYIDRSFEGLRHTELQLMQNQYELAFYPAGDWLEGEQAQTAPPDFSYQLMPVPGMENGRMATTAVRATAGEGFVVASRAKNPAGGLEYLRRMLSLEGSRGFVERVKVPTIRRESTDGVTLGSAMTSGQAALTAAGDGVLNYYYEAWYSALDKEAQVATNELMFGRIDAAGFARRMQVKADSLKSDPTATKFRR